MKVLEFKSKPKNKRKPVEESTTDKSRSNIGHVWAIYDKDSEHVAGKLKQRTRPGESLSSGAIRTSASGLRSNPSVNASPHLVLGVQIGSSENWAD